MIKASSLIYTIIIALVLAILSASIILSQYYKVIESENDILESKLRMNAISAINYFLVCDNYASPSDIKLNLYDGVADSVSIHIEKWGVLDLLTATASSGGKSFSKTALVGDLLDKKNSPAIYLADNNTPLALCGKTIIKGNCTLPRSGVKRAYIEGQNFIGNKLIDGEIALSNASLPPLDKGFLDYISKVTNYTSSADDSIILFPSVTTAYRSFDKPNNIIFSNEYLHLTNNDFEGKIIIISKKEIEVSGETKLKDLILFAPKIIIDDEFSGSLQVFATDSIYIGKNVNLRYPSVVSTISATDKSKHPVITLDEGSRIAGLILMDAGFDPVNKRINLNLAKGTLVTGTVYCNGIVNMNGTITGNIFCNLFLLKTPSAIYENNLLNSTIDISKVPDDFSMKNLLNNKSQRRIIKWL